MSDEDFKIYGCCLERIKFQIRDAQKRRARPVDGKVVLESYFTGELEEIVDLLELYDLDEKTCEALEEKLADLAFDVSLLAREKVSFDYDQRGDLCLFWLPGADYQAV